MKQLIVGILAGIFLLFSANTASALISVMADVPVSHAFTAAGSPSTSAKGTKLGVSFLVGLALEKYAVTSEEPGATGEYAVSMYDIFISPPIPFINVTLGAGVGKGEFNQQHPLYNKYSPTPHTQLFMTVGYPIFGILDLHVGMHKISGKAKPKPGSGVPEFDASARMYTLGASLGF